MMALVLSTGSLAIRPLAERVPKGALAAGTDMTSMEQNPDHIWPP